MEEKEWEDMNIRIRNIMFAARCEYVKWLINPKILLMFTLIVPIREIVIIPLIQAAHDMNQPINILEPCIAVMNSGYILLLVPLIYIVLISSFPTVDGNVYYYISRMGRKNWIIGEILFQLMSVGTFVLVIMGSTIVQTVGDSFLTDGWSIVVTDYDSSCGNVTGLQMKNILSPKLYNQMSPYKAFILSAVMLMLLLFLCSMIFLAGCICARRLVFYLIVLIQIVLGMAMCGLEVPVMWLFPVCHSILQIHYQEYFRAYIFPPCMSIAILAGSITILSIYAYRKSVKVDISCISDYFQ